MRLIQRFLPLILMSGGLGSYSLANHVSPSLFIIMMVLGLIIGFVKKLVKIAIGLSFMCIAYVLISNYILV